MPHRSPAPAGSSSDPHALTPLRLRRIVDLPRPLGWPVFGHWFQLRNPSLHTTMAGWAQRYGPLYRLNSMGHGVLVVDDREAVSALLLGSVKNAKCAKDAEGLTSTGGAAPVADIIGFGVDAFFATGTPWGDQRRRVMAGLSAGSMQAYFHSLVRATQDLKWRWRQAAQADSAVDLEADLMRFSADAVAGLALDDEFEPDQHGSAQGAVWLLLRADEVATSRTTVRLIELLFRHPDMLALAHSEVCRVVIDSGKHRAEGDGDCDSEASIPLAYFADLEFVTACIHETQRLHPVVTRLVFQANCDTVIADVQVPQNTSVWAMLRLGRVQEHVVLYPAAFDPFRWLPEDDSATDSDALPDPIPLPMHPEDNADIVAILIVLVMLLSCFEIVGVDAAGSARLRLRTTD
jgi:cytochrome P450